MVDKKMWHEEDDTLQSQIDSDHEDYIEFELDKFKGIYHKDNGIPAKNHLDLGRNCPRCAGRLELKEITEKNENVLLYCKHCGLQVFAEDIDFRGDVPDQLYRTIPQSVINYWENFRINRNKN